MPSDELHKEQYENILRYLDGLMTPGEERHFEDQLKINQTLREALAFENEVRDYMEAPEEKAFLQEVGIDPDAAYNDIHNIRSFVEKEGARWKQKKNKTFRLRSILVYAAAACVVGFIVFFTWKTPANKNEQVAKNNTGQPPAGTNKDTGHITATIQSTKNDPAELFKKYFSMDKISGKKPELLAEALDNYDNGNYEKIREMDLTNIPPPEQTRGSDEEEDTITNSPGNIKQLGHYYKGLALIKMDKISKAKSNLQWVLDSASSYKLKIKSEWYLSLIYIKEGEIEDKAVPLLKHVSSSTIVPYNKKAEELLGSWIRSR